MTRVELPGGVCATDGEALDALVVEARRRKVSYGELVAGTTAWERDQIIRDYCAAKWKKARRHRA